MNTIKITDHVDDFVTNSSGYALFLVLTKALSDDNTIELSFHGVPATSSSFLNSSLGAVVDDLGITVLNRIKPVHVSGTQAAILKKYVLSLRKING